MSSSGKENRHLVSVILPVFNAAATVKETIQSVIGQSYTCWEMLIIDDGSEDNSAAVITKFIGILPDAIRAKIKYIRKNNGGPSKARNTGIELAKGEFIAFIDSDDIWVQNKLHIQYSIAKRFPNAGIIAGGFERNIIKCDKEFVEIHFADLLKRNYFNTPAVFVRRALLENTRFPETQKYSEDYRLWLEITYANVGIYINAILARNVHSKHTYGVSGLSADLWAMEKGEISNFVALRKENKLNSAQFIFYSVISLLKFVRRTLIIKLNLYDK